MLHRPHPIPPSAAFWRDCARALLDHAELLAPAGGAHGWAEVRVVVPTFWHARRLQAALAQEVGAAFVPPRITTLAAWLALLPPEPDSAPAGSGERLMTVYAELRQHPWLKKLFGARRNPDLLPLAQTLLALCDELSAALLPRLSDGQDALGRRWQAALEQIAPAGGGFLSAEAQLVWSVWKSQLDGGDPAAVHWRRMMRLAARAPHPLVWISPLEADAVERAFLDEYGRRQEVLPVTLDWRAASLPPACALAWPEIASEPCEPRRPELPSNVFLCGAPGLEPQAQQGAQTVIDWLRAGKSNIAIVAQDRLAARRIRALLERAQVLVADETGWKLSTTRAAAAVDAWLEVVAARAETGALLNFLKSPFVLAAMEDKPARLMKIELTLRAANVQGGWTALAAALADAPEAAGIVAALAGEAARCRGTRTLAQWCELSAATLDALGMRDALAADAAGLQVLAQLDAVARECAALAHPFSFGEWRTFIALQFELASFMPPQPDRRVVMLPLNGTRLRAFDAVLLVGADAAHLPSAPAETLFFSNAVRRELGLATRESRQRQQLRDFAELLSCSGETVLSWQTVRDDEANPVSPWIERLQLALAEAGTLPARRAELARRTLQPRRCAPPAPSAPHLLPAALSASAFNSFAACPYQFFATRMLGLAPLDELVDMPQKRDYGDWLHRILQRFHSSVSERAISDGAAREALLREISERVFADALERSGAALGYYVRWQKAIPAYLAWAEAREAQGWRFAAGEQACEKELRWDGGSIRLRGRIDRIDLGPDGAVALLDYKAGGLPALRDRLRQREDHQLAFYGLLSAQPAQAAHYVALEPANGRIADAAAPDYAEWQALLEQRIAGAMQAVARGAPLPAYGIEAACAYCDMRGLCRKGAW